MSCTRGVIALYLCTTLRKLKVYLKLIASLLASNRVEILKQVYLTGVTTRIHRVTNIGAHKDSIFNIKVVVAAKRAETLSNGRRVDINIQRALVYNMVYLVIIESNKGLDTILGNIDASIYKHLGTNFIARKREVAISIIDCIRCGIETKLILTNRNGSHLLTLGSRS